MATPDVYSYGPEGEAGVGSTTLERTPGLPDYYGIGYTIMLFVASDGVPATLETANGWAIAADPAGNQASVGIPGECAISIFWKRAATDPETPPVIAAPSGGGTCLCWHMVTYAGARTNGTPFHKVIPTTVNTPTAVIAPPAVTTLLADTMIGGVAASAEDDTLFHSWDGSAGVTNSTIDSGSHTAIGNDASWVGGRGELATPGTGSLSSIFQFATKQAQISYALASIDESSATAAIVYDDDVFAGTATATATATATLVDEDDGVAGAATALASVTVALVDDDSELSSDANAIASVTASIVYRDDVFGEGQFTADALASLYPDNVIGEITPRRVRDLVESVVPSSGSLRYTSGSTPIAVAGTYVKAANATVLQSGAYRFDAPAANRLRYLGEATVEATVLGALSVAAAAAAQTVAIGIAKNGVLDENSVVRAVIGADALAVPVVAEIAELEAEDYIELWVTNETSTAAVTVDHGHLRVLAFIT